LGGYTITVCNQPTRSTQPCIPPGSLNRVPASAGGKGWNITSAGWQVTLCDPIWHVSSSSGVATSVSELLYPCYLLLTYFLGGAGSPSNTVWPGPRPIPSGILIHPTVWPQYTVTDRQKVQRSDSIGRTVLHTVAQNCWGQFLLRHSVATYAAKRRRRRARVMGVSPEVAHAAVRAEGVGAELVPFVTSHVCMSLLLPFLGHLHPCIAFMAALMYVCMYVREFITGAP